MFSRIHCLIALITLTAATVAAQPTVTSVTPARHDTDATNSSNLTAGFSTAMAAPGADDFRVRSNLRGWLTGSLSGGGTTSLTFNPTTDLLPGEEIEGTLTTGLQASGGAALANGYNWRFRAAASQGPTVFTSAVQATGVASGWDAEFGDLDGDGDLDMVAIDNGQSYILINNGAGVFNATLLSSNYYGSYHCALADVESDGDLDIIMVSSPMATSTGQWSGQNLIYLNDGNAGFANVTNFGTGSEYSIDVDAGDIDGDGDVDFVVANGAVSDIPNDIYINDGSGNFTRRAFLFVAGSTAEVSDNSWAIRLADIDNDGDLDVFTGNFGFGPVQSYYYLNDGAGNFYYTSRVDLGAAAIAVSMATGDFNGDGWVDVALGHLGQSAYGTSNRVSVYFNNGSGAYGSPLVFSASDVPYALEAGDIDGDGDLDLGIGFESGTSYVRTNPGNGQFSGSINLVGTSHSMAFADVDGDGDLDVGMPDRICINGSNPPTISATANGSTLANGGTLNVSYGTTLASLNMHFTIDDPNGGTVSVSAQISNLTTQGLVPAEFTHATAAVSYTIDPTSGTFNQGTTNHHFVLTATDGIENTPFSFDIVVGAAPNNSPAIALTSGGSTVANGSTINVAYGDTLAGLSLAIAVSDPENDSVGLAGSITNASGTGLLASEFSSSAQATSYVLYPTSGTFNSGTTTHTFTLSADDGNGGTANFSFSVAVGAAPTPSIEIYESTVGGATIGNGSNASGGRDFGSQLVSAGPTGALTVVIYNAGNANLSIPSIVLTGTDAGHFVLNTSGTSSSVYPSDYTQFTVAFDPTSAGSKAANIEISHNDGSIGTPYTFQVAGVGTTPAPVPLIVVREGGSNIANGASASGNRNFGSLLVGTASGALTIEVQNAGNADLNVGTPSLSGTGAAEFSVNTTGMLSVVPAGQSTTFTVTYLAAAEGTFGATVSFSHDDTTTATPFTFGVVGSATAPSAGGNGGGSDGSSGGCVATGNSSLIALALLMMLGGLAVVRRRARA
ncbi:MAG: VCBS repeat-containing protein [Planctomycetes bacterium]|nr:VCBS repeat-containing protein [Planctomycetota bacterium]